MNHLKGVLTALITPFKNQKIDFVSLEKLIRWQLNSDVKGFVVNGTTAESPTLKKTEVEEIFKFIKSKSPKNFPLIIGTGSNCTEKTIENSRAAEAFGAHGVLVVVPYYNKPPQRGLVKHFEAVASAIAIPNILYNVPSRTVASLELETIKTLSKHPNIIGIKEASGNIEFAQAIRKACPKDFLLLSGDDGTSDQFMASGGDGIISVASHIIPTAMIERKATAYQELIDMLFIEANPIPVKMALHLMGIIESPECRLPLVTLSDLSKEKLQGLMQQKALLK